MKNDITFKGKKWQDIYNLSSTDVARLDKSALTIAVNRLSRVANKRLEAFRLINEDTPATKWAERSGGYFTSKDKSFNQLRSEFRRVRDFIASETSTIEGWQKVKNTVITTLKEKHDIELNDSDYDKMWRAYDIISREDPDFKSKENKYRLLAEIETRLYDQRSTGKSIARKLFNNAELLENLKKEKSYNDGVSGFFDEIE